MKVTVANKANYVLREGCAKTECMEAFVGFISHVMLATFKGAIWPKPKHGICGLNA